ncbi:Gfo/Idh/MocA family oxidoreductase [Humibacter soli]
MSNVNNLRIGVLGAARIVHHALITPAAGIPGVDVTVIGARDGERAAAHARKYGIPAAVTGYDRVLEHPEVDAVYIPLPNSLHAEWVLKAVEAGKHVLCEKPFVSNAAQAQRVAAAVAGEGKIVMQAFHYRYHPFTERIRQVVASGELGAIRSIEVVLHAPIPPGKDIRWSFDLAGGSMMDLGSYAAHMLRHVIGEEPEVVSAAAKTWRKGSVDRWMRGEVAFPSGAMGGFSVAMWSGRLLTMGLHVIGEQGEMHVRNPLMPQLLGKAVIHTPTGRTVDRAEHRSSYAAQLEAFRNAVLHGRPVITDPDDAVATMKIIDATYTAAGLPIRPGE